MATISFGSTPGAPGTYITERAGNIATPPIASFETTYMLVEADDSVSAAPGGFPYNTPTPVSSLTDYRALLGGFIPESRIPLLSYKCVETFFANAQVGDLRVVRVGTPNQIIEVELFPSGTKINSTGLPSNLEAGNVVYVQMTLNNNKLVAGNGSTGYTTSGEWLGVPVTIPVDYIPGDYVNNRKISAAIATAIAAAIESNPSISSSVYVRDFGLVNDVDPSQPNAETGFVSLAASTFDGNVSVVTQVLPVGSASVFMQNTYVIENIVGQQNNLERVPQDYIQCIKTAFDGQVNQGYLIAPTAYAQFDAEGRTAVGDAAANLVQRSEYKWMALADAGPYLITDINKYKDYVPHGAAESLITGVKYLVDNAIYEWTGVDVSYDRLRHQSLVPGAYAEPAIRESVESVGDGERIGILDTASFTVNSIAASAIGKFSLDVATVWPVAYQIQEVVLSGNPVGNAFNSLGDTAYIVAPPYDTELYGPYPSDGSTQYVYLATSAAAAASILQQVNSAGGTSKMVAAPAGSVAFTTATVGDTVSASYEVPAWDLPVNINGQVSNLIENTSGSSAYVNTLHLPGSLQNATNELRLEFKSRTILDPSSALSSGSSPFATRAVLEVVDHGLKNGQKVFFTKAITFNNGASTLVRATTKNVIRPYFVRVVDTDHIVLAESLTNYSAGSYLPYPTTGTISVDPTIIYSTISGGNIASPQLSELDTISMIRGRKYALNTGTIASQAADASASPAPFSSGNEVNVSMYLGTSSQTIGKNVIFPYGETTTADWLPSLALVAAGSSTTVTENYLCTPTVDQFFASEAHIVPTVDAIFGGNYNPAATGTKGPIDTLGTIVGGTLYTNGTYTNVPLTGGTGSRALATVTVAGGSVTAVAVTDPGHGFTAADVLSANASDIGGTGSGFTVPVTAILNSTSGSISSPSTFVLAAGLKAASSSNDLDSAIDAIEGVYFNVVTSVGFAPDGVTSVVVGDRIVASYDGSNYSWTVVKANSLGGDLTGAGHVCYGSQLQVVLSPEQTPPTTIWKFDAVTSTEIISDALRGVGFSGVPQAVFIEAGVDSDDRLYEDSQRYFNAFGFIAWYGPWILATDDSYIPLSAYVAGVAVRRYRAEGFQFPPAGVKYQLANAKGVQIKISSSQQNLLNPAGCNVARSLPGYPQEAVFIWAGRTRVNTANAEQKKFQFVNVRVIQNVVYGSLRNAFDNQIFEVINGFGVVFNQITSIGNSVMSQLYQAGALFGSTPSEAFQVICDDRLNRSANLEDGIVYVKFFDVPAITLERIDGDLIRVSVGQMQNELESQGL